MGFKGMAMMLQMGVVMGSKSKEAKWGTTKGPQVCNWFPMGYIGVAIECQWELERCTIGLQKGLHQDANWGAHEAMGKAVWMESKGSHGLVKWVAKGPLP